MKIKYKQYLSRKMLSILLLGFSSGLPIALVGSLLQAWFKISGIGLLVVGFLSLLGQPYAYKFLWAPFVDQFDPPIFNKLVKKLGRRRGWILITQISIVIIIVGMALLDPKKTPWLLCSLGLLLAVMSATQDIVIDGYRVNILAKDELGLGSALANEGYRIANIITGGFGFILADHFGWQNTYLIIASLMLFGWIGLWLSAAETITHEQLTKNHISLKQLILAPLWQFLTREKAGWLLALIILFKLGDALSHALATVFLLDLGFSLTDLATINKFVSLTAVLLGVMLAGVIMLKINLFKAMLLFGCLQSVTNLLYSFLALCGANYYLAISVFFIENLCAGMGTNALLALLTGLCDRRYAATQFALLSSLSVLGRIYIGPIAGYLAKNFGWNIFYLVSAVAAIPGILLIMILKKQILECGIGKTKD